MCVRMCVRVHVCVCARVCACACVRVRVRVRVCEVGGVHSLAHRPPLVLPPASCTAARARTPCRGARLKRVDLLQSHKGLARGACGHARRECVRPFAVAFRPRVSALVKLSQNSLTPRRPAMRSSLFLFLTVQRSTSTGVCLGPRLSFVWSTLVGAREEIYPYVCDILQLVL